MLTNQFSLGEETMPWSNLDEGQLSVDVIETPKDLIVRSTIAGVLAKNLDIYITHDTLTIRGYREPECELSNSDVIHVQECHWGKFSRSIVLPSPINPDGATATIKSGVLSVTMPKVGHASNIKVTEISDI